MVLLSGNEFGNIWSLNHDFEITLPDKIPMCSTWGKFIGYLIKAFFGGRRLGPYLGYDTHSSTNIGFRKLERFYLQKV